MESHSSSTAWPLPFDRKDGFRHVLGVFARVDPRLWVAVGVCRLELAAPARWHEQPQGAELAQSRARADGCLTGGRMPASREADGRLAPAERLPHGVQNACHDVDLFQRF